MSESANDVPPPHAESIQHLRSMLRRGDDASAFEIGDALLKLVPRLNVPRRLAWLSDQLNTSISRLSEFQSVARAFPPDQRGDGNFQISLLAYRIHRRMGHALKMPLVVIREQIASLRGGRRYRQVRDHFIRLRVRQKTPAEATPLNAADPETADAEKCFFGNYLDGSKRLGPASVHLIMADPPYGQRSPYPAGNAAIGRACDYEQADEALAMTLALFEAATRFLVHDGIIVLFQAGMRADRPEVLHAARRSGFHCLHALTWLKYPLNSLPSRKLRTPYGAATERILIFSRQKELFRSFDRLAIPDVLSFPIDAPAAIAQMDAGLREYGDAHIYEKPAGLCRLLIETHTRVGDRVFEPFGCTGSACVAAIEVDRTFFYCETHPENYRLGRRRIDNALFVQKHKAETLRGGVNRSITEP